ncbi:MULTISPECIES: N-acetylmuramoyl-L-alanine amidase [unclassified Streptomyces]|uniref:N-acetylmuramoyl-L-alanine amidase n=1 Tax=unclassified Streptomyces TaxID=2593676 RepID=UPI002E334100|nr:MULTISPECIES: N-acetylmuramoyl-L-alanine amidase [unclassified Streptomyces]
MHKRKKRLRLSAALAVSALTAGGLATLPFTALADTARNGPDASRQQDFSAAAARYHIPLDILLGLAYQESGWQSHGELPSTDGGFGPMHLTDVTPAMMAGNDAGAAGRSDLATLAANPALHTLQAAAELTGLSPETLRSDPAANIRGGAALLASYQKELTGGTPADAAQWYGAVARYSQSTQKQAAVRFADRVFATIRAGATGGTDDGGRVRLAAAPSVRPATAQVDRLHLKAAAATAADIECPASVDCSFVPGSAAGGQVSNRPANGIRIDTIVIHDLESTYQAGINTLADPKNAASTHYVMRSSDGAVTQMVPTKDIAFQAGNYSSNLHSIGIEHEGYAAQGATWYTEAQYEATADLVKYLAGRFGIPLDRQHIIGHDNVAGPNSSLVSGMHWDPGNGWDWDHFMRLLGRPLGGPHATPSIGSVVTIDPPFADNVQTVNVCPADDPTGATPACTDKEQASNFVYLRTAPDATAPLFADQAIHPTGTGTDRINDWGSTAQSGQQFVVADVQDDWTAIWYSGAKVWFHNPDGENTRTAYGVKIIKPSGTSPVAVYGSSYPDKSEYPTGLGASTQAPLSMYTVPAGQAYVATQAPAATDDYFTSGAVVIGAKKMYTVQYNHRVALLYADDVTATTATHHWEDGGN